MFGGTDLWRRAGSLFFVGTVLSACIVVGYFIGTFLDETFSTAPWFMLAFVGIGSIAGFVEMFKITKRYLK